MSVIEIYIFKVLIEKMYLFYKYKQLVIFVGGITENVCNKLSIDLIHVFVKCLS